MSVAGIPMTFAERAVGSLDIYDGHVRGWTEHDLTTARVLADIATGYLVHASELDRARRVNERLEAALRSRVLIEQAKGLLAGSGASASTRRSRCCATTPAAAMPRSTPSRKLSWDSASGLSRRGGQPASAARGSICSP
jgi:hypothetical protein